MKTNYEIRYASHPEDAKHYDTARIRRDFLIERVFADNEVNLVYSMYDRMVVGGAKPVGEELLLEAIDPLKAPFFTTRREIGIFNVGGSGTVKVGDEEFHLDYKEALYIGRGDRNVTFQSDDAAKPAKFYLNSAPAHKTYPTVLIKREGTPSEDVVIIKDENKKELGSLEGANHRVINNYILPGQVETCQLEMGMTELKPGSVWNTMPCHTHDRRMEVYLYFDMPEDALVMHFMGEPTETRHIIMRNEQAVISPSWSIHSGCGTQAYTFIWGMVGENQDFDDMDDCAMQDLL